MEKKYRKAIRELHTMISPHVDQFILTGSCALYYYGFNTPPKDIDLVVVAP
jgi:hypothetical protein